MIKRHNLIKLFILLILVLSVIVIIKNYLSYWSVKTYSEISAEEYNNICNEFFINQDYVYFEHIYCQGSDRYGIRIKLEDCDEKYIDKALFCDFSLTDLSWYLNNSTYYKYNTSDGINVSAKKIDNCLPNTNGALGIYVFKIGGECFMEIEKNKTDNINIFNNLY